MDVIGSAADRDGFEPIFACDPAEERSKAGSDLILDYGQSLFRGKHDVCKLGDVCVRHTIVSRPCGTRTGLDVNPALETPGYWQSSLRDAEQADQYTKSAYLRSLFTRHWPTVQFLSGIRTRLFDTYAPATTHRSCWGAP